MKVIVDASVVVDYLRRRQAHDESLFIKFSRIGTVVFSLVTVAELYSGKSAQDEGSQREYIDSLIDGAEVMIPTVKTAKTVGMLRATYQLSLGDAFVAALAIEEKLPVLTADKKAFEKVKVVRLLRDI
ncbi:MAG: PIN domain-containing protein [Patescibacteria group bacterium]